ncbi:hypothetical protein [Thalassomonas actiniarum]|uniref:Uncharacterized protein n=1 Tax=Thalassomonas actiniarum TaxID=485447 RepID=A0AAE9YXT3_9GAMM|nr:hypothetical protein [Thalassomonas actiniarum]WDE02405.1 hypothetical protein SG35_028755 [Thalassomonas actiniarum]
MRLYQLGFDMKKLSPRQIFLVFIFVYFRLNSQCKFFRRKNVRNVFRFAALSLLMFSSLTSAQQQNEDVAIIPKAIVAASYDFCAKQLHDLDGDEAEQFLLDCVNLDLQRQSYPVFSSYEQLLDFIHEAELELLS